MLVHFPIALLLASVVFDVLGALRRDERLHFAGYVTLIGGAAGAVPAFGSGLLQAERLQERFARLRETTGANGFGGAGFPGGEEMRQQMMQMVSIHRLLAIAVLIIFLVLLFWRVSRKGLLSGGTLNSYLAVAVLGAAILAATGFYGGKLGHGRRGGPEGGRPAARMNVDQPGGAGFSGDQGAGNMDGMPQGDGNPR